MNADRLTELKKVLYKEKPMAKYVSSNEDRSISYIAETSKGDVYFNVPFNESISDDGKEIFGIEEPAQLLIRWIVGDKKLPIMNFRDYQELAETTAMYPENAKITYPLLGLNGEIGEVCEKVKKHIRDGRELDKEDLTKELGDVLWYLAITARDLGIDLQEVAEVNIAKLKSRQERGVLGGSGDNR